MSNVVGFSTFRRSNDENDENDERQPNQYYAGGASQGGGGSGLSVIGPDDGQNGTSRDAMANIIARARNQRSDGNSQGNTGQGAQNDSVQRYAITFYRDGFTVNDGPYRPRDDPANRQFLEAIEKGVVPQELEGEDRSAPVDIMLVDKRNEEYKPPATPAYVAFSGEGQSMGGATYDRSVVVQGQAEALTAERPVIDDQKPTTTLQIRLHNGTRLRETLNLHNTIRDLHTIIHFAGAGDQPYTLLAGYPPRPLPLEMEKTIEEAGLKGAAITQKLI